MHKHDAFACSFGLHRFSKLDINDASTVTHGRANDFHNTMIHNGVECVNVKIAYLGGGLVSGWLLSIPNTS